MYYVTKWKYSDDNYDDSGKYLTCQFAVLFVEDEEVFNLARKVVQLDDFLQKRNITTIHDDFVNACKYLLSNKHEISQELYVNSLPFASAVSFCVDHGGMTIIPWPIFIDKIKIDLTGVIEEQRKLKPRIRKRIKK